MTVFDRDFFILRSWDVDHFVDHEADQCKCKHIINTIITIETVLICASEYMLGGSFLVPFF